MSTQRPKLDRSRRVAALVVSATLAAAGTVLALQSGETSLHERVERALFSQGPALAGVRAEIKDDGVVELVGTVDSLAARDAAEEAASETPSVQAVVNRIQVRGTDRSAAEIERDYREMLRNEMATESFEFDVDADDEKGLLTLSGTVDSPAERRLAELAARRVRGVQEIRNEINVRPGGKTRPDAEIEEEIRGLYKWDARVDDSLVAVSVRNGVVSLAGVARTPTEKAQAILLAHVDGVKRVEAPELLVELDPSGLGEAPEVAATDQEIERALEHALAVDARVPDESLKVRVEDGVARLEGKVGRLSAKRIAEEDARNVAGVVDVSNAIEIVPTEELTDAQIAANVRTLLAFDPFVGKENVNVSVDRGVVTLTGQVASRREVDRAVQAASRARGVLEVRSELTLPSPSD